MMMTLRFYLVIIGIRMKMNFYTPTNKPAHCEDQNKFVYILRETQSEDKLLLRGFEYP